MSTLDLNTRIDSRDLIDRLTALGVDDYAAPMHHDPNHDDFPGFADVDADDREEASHLIQALVILRDNSGGDTPEDGIFGVAESDWVEYAQEFADDIGATPEAGRWPLYCIDWERAARDLAQDYRFVTIDGTDYYVR